MNTNVKYLGYIFYLLLSIVSVIKHNNMKKTASEARTSTDFNSICRAKNAEASLYKFPLSQICFSFFSPHHSFCYTCGFYLFTRPRKELDMYKEGELELLREALSSEIHFLKSVSVCVLNKASLSVCISISPARLTDMIVCTSDSTEKNLILKYNKQCSTLLFKKC